MSAKPSIISSLHNICNDPEVNKDAKFLDNFQKAFKDNDTSFMFKPQLNKVRSAFYEARRSVKKRILTDTNIIKQRNSEANANENESTSALINIAQEDNSNIFELL